MTDDGFLAMVAKRMGRTPQYVLEHYVVLPCACGTRTCPGWLTILRSDQKMRDGHMRKDHPKPGQSITRDDYLAREQRRLTGVRYSWRPQPKETP